MRVGREEIEIKETKRDNKEQKKRKRKEERVSKGEITKPGKP